MNIIIVFILSSGVLITHNEMAAWRCGVLTKPSSVMFFISAELSAETSAISPNR
jgi:hypothetical protein